jgi:solute carrier family 35 protein F5
MIGFFTLALGRICRVETLTKTKIIASVVRYVHLLKCISLTKSFFGVILVTQSDSAISSTDNSDIPSHPILGDMLALTSACCFAVYVVLMKVKLGSEDRADMQMLLG